MKKFVSFCACICFVQSTHAQLEASQWYFGEYAGLDFRNGAPSALAEGALSTLEGSASICDVEGNLLFYTDGVTVFNRNHQHMPNGNNLWGSYNTAQTLIVPKPGNDPVYYIFTASPNFDWVFGQDADSVGFHYSVVNMDQQGGLGDVTQKNVLLFRNTTEKVTAALHANGQDIWVVAHEWGNSNFRSYLVTENGISEPVVTSVGNIHEGDGAAIGSRGNAIGEMKFSPDGTKIAVVIWEKSVECFDFDSKTGIPSNAKILFTKSNLPKLLVYGVCYSADGNRLYFTDLFPNCGTEIEKSFIYQYDLPSHSLEVVGEYIGVAASLQLAPDGRIYVAQCNTFFPNSSTIGVINNPSRKGRACNYQSETGFTNGGSFLGLPNFIQSYFLFPDPVVDMPNVFTPNGDDYNPVFKPITYEHLLEAHLKIINRWGQEVYSTFNVEDGWDGGKAPAGVYYWLLQYEGKNGKTGTLKGYVHLIQ